MTSRGGHLRKYCVRILDLSRRFLNIKKTNTDSAVLIKPRYLEHRRVKLHSVMDTAESDSTVTLTLLSQASQFY